MELTMSKPRHPDLVLAELKDGKAESRQERLEALHAICSERFAAGETDLSIATIGRIASERGVMNGRGLFNKGLEIYRDLLGAWQAFSDNHHFGEGANSSTNHPDGLLIKLISRSAMRGDRKAKLRQFHELCRRHHATGSLDWSKITIGRLCEEQGILAVDSIKSQEFQEYRELLDAWARHARPWLESDVTLSPPGDKPIQKSHDIELTWVRNDYPQHEEWRVLARDWLQTATKGLNQRIAAMGVFFQRYLSHPDVPSGPAQMLSRANNTPGFEVAFDKQTFSHNYNNHITKFIDWVLLQEFSEETDDGERVVSPAVKNPFSVKAKTSKGYFPAESVRSPLPYGYIHELRCILAEGPDFRDWKFAQTALGAKTGERGVPGRDWFEVPETLVDRDDPDCVWRTRRNSNGEEIVQMWSPVRWVAVLVKLILPLRTIQVRMMDSGESDTYVYQSGQWVKNHHPIAAREQSQRRVWAQGVLRRSPNSGDKGAAPTLLYINTNKTADQFLSGPEKGYVLTWYAANNYVEDVFRWLEKMRDWQRKYNPISKRTSWSELDARHIAAKSEAQLASFPDACFLFRLAESKDRESTLPVSDGITDIAWMNLLEEFQKRLAARGETHPGGQAIEFVTRGSAGRLSTEFPMHSLRVSLITALALDGEVPFPILQKLVGHSRLLMTLYYTKAGQARVEAVMIEAAKRLDSKKDASVVEFLLNTEHAELVANAVANSSASLAMAIPVHKADRNAAGWSPRHHGLCLVGGNTSEDQDNKRVGGCYNGGPLIGAASRQTYGPVPGGSNNCVRCRWFVTEPHYLPALAAQFNAYAYHFDEARNKAMALEQKLQQLKREKASAEAGEDGVPGVFLKFSELKQTERAWEAAMKQFSDLAEDLVACWRLIERCKAVLAKGSSDGLQLIVHGSGLEVEAIFEETESELLQLVGVCENLELYPDLEASQAVIRRSQLLDSALYNDGLPPMFVRLSAAEQLLAGNALMRRLAQIANPDNLLLGQRQVVSILDAGGRLSEQLGVDISSEVALSTSTTKNHPIKKLSQ